MMAPISEDQTVVLVRNVLDGASPGTGSWDDILRGRSRVRRHRLMAVSLVAVIALIAGVVGAFAASRSGPSRLTEVTSPTPQVFVVSSRVESSQSYAALAVGGGSVFAADWNSGYLLRYNAVTLRPTGRLLVGGPSNSILSLAYGYGSVWALDFSTGDLLRIDPQTMTIGDRTPIGDVQPSAVAVGDGSVWVTACCGSTRSSRGSALLRANPRTGSLAELESLPGSGQSLRLAVGDVVAVSGETGPIYFVPPSTGDIRTMPNPGESPVSLAAADGKLYALSADNAIVRLDVATGREPVVVPSQGYVSSDETEGNDRLASDGHSLWLSTDRGILRFDPATGSITARATVPDVGDLLVTPTAVYVSRGHDIERLTARS